MNEKNSAGVIFQWSLTIEKIDREEAYFVRSTDGTAVEVDQARSVKEDTASLRLEVDKQEKLGSAVGKLHHNTGIEEQIENLIQAASLGEERKWSLGTTPFKPEPYTNQSDPIVWESLGLP